MFHPLSHTLLTHSASLPFSRPSVTRNRRRLLIPQSSLDLSTSLARIPDDPNDTVTRLLFPGSTPQHKVLRGLDKLRALEAINKPGWPTFSHFKNAVEGKVGISITALHDFHSSFIPRHFEKLSHPSRITRMEFKCP